MNQKYYGKKQIMLSDKKLPYNFLHNGEKIILLSRIYSGYNSEVYDCIYNQKKYIIKFFKGKKERYERFKLEIQKIERINNLIDGFTPKIITKNIISYNRKFLYKVKYEYSPFFVMEKANRFAYDEMNFIDKIDSLLEIGLSLSRLHSFDIQHRDIKIENIVRYNETLTFIDFSTTKVPDFRTINPIEKMGSLATMAPEMFNHASDIPNYKYEYADIYSFGKIMWTVLTNNLYSNKFSTYDLEDVNNKISINGVDDGIILLLEEIIHNATLDNYFKRISLDEILKYLHLIRENLIDNSENCNVIKFIYVLKLYMDKKYDFVLIESFDKIVSFLEKMSNVCVKIHLFNGKNIICDSITVKDFFIDYDKYFSFKLKNGIKYSFDIKKIELNNQRVIIMCADISDEYKNSNGISLNKVDNFSRRSILTNIIDDSIKEIYLDCEICLEKCDIDIN